MFSQLDLNHPLGFTPKSEVCEATQILISYMTLYEKCVLTPYTSQFFNPEHNPDGQKLTRIKINVEIGSAVSSPLLLKKEKATFLTASPLVRTFP